MALGFLFFYIKPVYSFILFVALAIGWFAAWLFVYRKTMYKIWFVISMILFIVFTYSILNIPFIQNWLVTKVTRQLSKDLHTKVTIKHIDLSFFNKMLLEGVVLEDQHKDTLLYAGLAKVNITDWFFLKDQATLQYVGLKDAVVNLNRTDSVWNYQFLVDYFSSPSSNNPKKKGIELDLKVLELENIHFRKSDKWVGQDMVVGIKKLDLSADLINFTKKEIYISTLRLDAPQFFQSNYRGNKPKAANLADIVQKIPVLSALRWNTGGWKVNVKDMQINNAQFTNEKQTERAPYTDRFDGQHLQFTNISGHLKNIEFINDTLTTNLQLSAREKSGLQIKQLQANVRFTPELMEFSDLLLEINKSRLQHYYSMRYNDFNEDLSSFLHSVTLEGRFENSVLHSDDLAIFAPKLKSWNRVFAIQGTAKGTIDNLSAKKMLIRSGNTMVDGDIALRGLPDIMNTFIDFKSNDLQTNYADLVNIIPSLRYVTKPNIAGLGSIRFKGNFTGFINDFVAFGNINTGLGNINADLNMKLPAGRPAVYSGKLSSGGFDLGQFINSSQLGNIALEGKVIGSGFKLNELKAHFDGDIHRLNFSGYNYQHITINGNFEKQLFTGSGSVNDPNLRITDFNGSINLSEKEKQFNFEATLDKADLKNLKLTNQEFNLAGHFKLDFRGNNIDDFLGTARVYNARLLNTGNQLSFDSLRLSSFIVDGRKSLSLQSNEIDATITGNFKIGALDNAFRLFLNRYYPAYIKKPAHVVSEQDFDFDIKTKNVDQYTQLLDKRLSGFNNSTITGNLKLSTNELNVIADIPEFSYDGKLFTGTHLESRGGLDSLITAISVNDISINDSLHLPESKLLIASSNDVSNISLKTSASKTVSDAALNASVQTLNDGVIIHFFPSSIIINDKKWDLKKDGELTLRKSFIEANDITFSQDNQEIVISTEMDELSDHTNVIARLKKVNIYDITPLFLKKPRLEGLATGTITWKDPFGRSVIEYDATAEDFSFENNKVGNVKLKGDVNTTTGLIRFKANADDKDYKFDIDGSYNYKDSSENQMDIAFMAERFNISILNTYLGGIFSNMSGAATSNLKVSGGAGHKYITGSVTINDGSFKVNYTQVRYKFTNETIIFNPDEIDLGTVQLQDTLGNAGIASGKMYHNFFQDFAFDNVNFKTGTGPGTGKMLLLNTSKKDNSQFYGKVTGYASMTIDGPVSNMTMKIDGEPSATDSSHIYIPTGSSKEANQIDYIEFIQFGTQMADELKGKQSANIVVDMNIRANPACKVDVILDEALGDIIKGRGNGLLNIHVGNKEPLSIRGRYDITEGEYTFNFQTFLKKYFTINRGSITWNGDPYLATLDIDAEYVAKRVDLKPITSSRGFSQRDDLTIVAHITGILNKPDVNFEFKLPPESEIAKDFIALKKLDDYRTDKNEMLKQVASLLLLNTLISDQGNESFLSGGNTLSLAANTIGQILSGALTSAFNKILQKALNDNTISTYFDVSSNVDPNAASAQLEGAAKFGITKSYFNNRLIISFGGNVDYNNPYLLSARNSNLLLTPDFTAEWLLSKDGKVRVVGFRRTNLDITLGQRNRQGISLTYRTDFDRLSEIFAPNEEKRRRRMR